jgi:hypothetical protein
LTVNRGRVMSGSQIRNSVEIYLRNDPLIVTDCLLKIVLEHGSTSFGIIKPEYLLSLY